MVKIVISGAADYRSAHKGSASIVRAMLGTLSKAFPDAEFTILCAYLEPNPEQYGVKVLKDPILCPLRTVGGWFRLLFCFVWVLFYNYFNMKADMLVDPERRRSLHEYAKADIVLIDGGDLLSTLYGARALLGVLYSIFLTKLLKKTIVIYAQTIGPFTGRLNNFLVSYILNMTDLITVRDAFSQRYLLEMGIGKPQIHLTSDPALLLDAVAPERGQEILLKEGIDLNDKPVIGVNISQIIYRYGFPKLTGQEERREKYVKIMTEVIDYLTGELGSTVVLVPHVFGRPWRDERVINAFVHQKVANKRKVKLINNEYTPEELKSVIGQLDFLITSRMHPLIHAVSMNVPSIGIDYDHKVIALMKMLGQEKYVCHIKTLGFDELKQKIYSIYIAREAIRKELQPKIEVMKERARLNAKLVKNLLKEKGIL